MPKRKTKKRGLKLIISSILSSLLSFYKKSEFNRGLAVGLTITMIFGIGYTVARASLPTSTDLGSLDQSQYDNLFPPGYIKTTQRTFFHYMIDSDNSNTLEVGDDWTTESGYNDLVVYDENANPTINVSFFTNRLNDTESGNFSNCKKTYACGKIVTFKHTFQKHIVLYKDQRGTDKPNDFYFYDPEQIIVLPVGNYLSKVPKGTGADAISSSRATQYNLSFKNLLLVDKALAAEQNTTTQIDSQSSPFIDISEKDSTIFSGIEIDDKVNKTDEYLVATMNDLVYTYNLLNKDVFKPMSYLTRNSDYSYTYEGLTAEPQSKLPNKIPDNYAKGTKIALYFNSSSANITPIHKKHGNKLILKDKYLWNGDSWESINDEKWVHNANEKTTVKVTFYNESVQNYVHFTKDFLQHVTFDGSPEIGGENYNHLIVYNSGSNADSITRDTVELVVGSPDDQVLPENITNDDPIISYYDKNNILNLFIPKASAVAPANNEVVDITSIPIATFDSTLQTHMDELVEDGILPWQVFRPLWQFHGNNDDADKSYMYYDYDVYSYDTNLESVSPTKIDEELIGMGNLRDKNLTSYIDYAWNYTLPNTPIGDAAPSITGNNGYISINYDLRDSVNRFKFFPNTLDPVTSGEGLFIASSDSDISNTNIDNTSTTKTIGIRACISETGWGDTGGLGRGGGCYNGDTHVMTDYKIELNNVHVANSIGIPDWPEFREKLDYDLNLWIFHNDGSDGTTKAYITVPIIFDNPNYSEGAQPS